MCRDCGRPIGPHGVEVRAEPPEPDEGIRRNGGLEVMAGRYWLCGYHKRGQGFAGRRLQLLLLPPSGIARECPPARFTPDGGSRGGVAGAAAVEAALLRARHREEPIPLRVNRYGHARPTSAMGERSDARIASNDPGVVDVGRA